MNSSVFNNWRRIRSPSRMIMLWVGTLVAAVTIAYLLFFFHVIIPKYPSTITDNNLSISPTSCEIPALIACEDRVLRLSVNLPGTDLHLQYASDRVPGATTQHYDSRHIGLGGWTLDALNVYDPSTHKLYAGLGRTRVVDPVRPSSGSSAGHLLIASPDATEIYEFDSNGQQLATKDSLSGVALRTFKFDSQGKLETITDVTGHQTTIERDNHGFPLAIIGPSGLRIQLHLTADGYLDRIVPQAHAATTMKVARNGLITEFTDAAHNTRTYSYDNSGLLRKITDPNGSSTTFEGIATSGKIQVRSAMGRIWTYTTQELPDGRLHRSVVGPAGDKTDLIVTSDHKVSITYPSGLRRVEQWTPDPRWGFQSPRLASRKLSTPSGLHWQETAMVKSTLADRGDPLSLTTLVAERTIAGATYKRTFDRASRSITTAGPNGRQDRLTLDKSSRIHISQRGELAPIHIAYDDYGRISTLAIGDDMSRLFKWSFDDPLGLVRVRNPVGELSRIQYDTSGSPVWYSKGDGAAVSIRQDGLGRLVSIAPPGHAPYHLRYSPTGIVTEFSAPVPEGKSTPASISRTLNVDGQLTNVNGPSGTIATLSYSKSGQLSSIKMGNQSINATYDGTSTRLESLTGPDEERIMYNWDGPLMVSESFSGPVAGSVQRKFDNSIHIVSQTVDGRNPIKFSYDKRGRTISAGNLGLSYGSLERPTQARIGGLKEIWTYDDAGLPIKLRVTFGNHLIYRERELRDALGRVTNQKITMDGRTDELRLRYDSDGRLSSYTSSKRKTVYSYDRAGNRVKLVNGRASTSSKFDGLDRIQSSGNTHFSYNNSGDLTKVVSNKTTTYQYDKLGRLVGASMPNGRKIGYLLDGLGRRIGVQVNGKLVTGFLYSDALGPVAELNGSDAIVSRFVYSADNRVPKFMIRGTHAYALIADQLGSIRAVVDTTTGLIAERLDYDPFGRVTIDTAPGFQPFGFAGGLRDPLTGLVHFGAREYDPSTGRFITPDPLGFAGADTNLYRYSSGDPINKVDPTGTQDQSSGSCGPSEWSAGISFGLNEGIGSLQLSFGFNVQYFSNEGWALYDYIPSTAISRYGSGFSAGIGASANAATYHGDDPSCDPEGSWTGIFKTTGTSLGPASAEKFSGESDETGWSGLALGLGIGLPHVPLTHYSNATDYECDLGCGALNGDPHVLTGDGMAYDLQAAGEFEAVDGGAGDLQIQIRTEPLLNSKEVSIVTATALDVGGDRVGFYSGDPIEVHVSRKVVHITDPITLPHGGKVDHVVGGYRVTWPDGSLVEVVSDASTPLNVHVDLAATRKGTVVGLLGNQDGLITNDLMTRGHRYLKLPPLNAPNYAKVVYKTFAESWRIKPADSLFDYPPGASTATYTLRDFPSKVINTHNLPIDTHASAEALCRRSGVQQAPFLANCILDVGLTGEGSFASSAALAEAKTLPPTHTRYFSINIGDSVGPDRPLEGAGRLASADEVDSYAFETQAGQHWYLAAQPKCANEKIHWSLFNSDGHPLIDRLGGTDDSICENLGRFVASRGGWYTVKVSAPPDSKASGEYGFNLMPEPPDINATIAVGDVVSRDNPVPGAGRLMIPGAIHRYSFKATAGEAVYLQTDGCPVKALIWRLLDPNGMEISRRQTCMDLGRFDVPKKGTYTIVVGEGDSATARYGFKLLKVSPDGVFTLQSGDTVAEGSPGPGAGRIETPGSMDRYRFHASRGNHVAVTKLVSAKGSCSGDLRWDLLDPAGSTLYGNQIICSGAERPPVTAPSTGTFTLRVRGDDAATGTYGMQVTVTR